VVFWIGPGYEIFLAKPLANGKALSVPLVQAPGLTLLPVRAGGIWEHGQGGNASADTGHTHSHHQHGAGTDMHFWLDPANARAMVTATAETMAKYDPAHAMRYRKNASAAVGRLSTLEADFRATLAPVRQRPFVVFHDAFQYFEKRFGLAGSGSVLSHSGARPGARRVLALRRKFAETGIVCVFREPQFNPKLTAAIIRGTRVRMGALDPLGSGLPIGVGAYEALLRGLARDIVSCLEKR
jgi:zinc transport system substrate-binding protein